MFNASHRFCPVWAILKFRHLRPVLSNGEVAWSSKVGSIDNCRAEEPGDTK